MNYFIIFIFCISVIFTADAQPGTLDKSFGTDGIVITGEDINYCEAAAIQTDGKIIQAGSGSYMGIGGFLLIRFNADGTPDASFGKDGRVVTDIPDTYSETFFSVVVQPDGKIVAGGYIITDRVQVDIAIARYKSDGILDSSFGANGIIITSLQRDDYLTGLVLQPDGKIVAAGSTREKETDYRKSFVIRYLPDGKPDESFGDKGKVLNSFSSDIGIEDILLQPDGNIIIGGRYRFRNQFLLLRYLPDGNPDKDFGENGIVTVSFTNDIDDVFLSSIALQQDNKILAGGTTGQKGSVKQNITVVRLETDGKLDQSFGKEGIVITDFGDQSSEAKTVLLQPDGKIVSAGRYFNNTDISYFALTRYQSNGNIDSAFGVNGLQTTDVGGSGSSNDAVLQKDGKIVLAGHTFISNPLSNKFVLARYNGGDEVLATPAEQITAVQNAAGIILKWHTTAESNNDYFAVERSATAAAASFSEIARVGSKGNSTVKQQYAYTDKYPLPGDNYYRLKQTDADGIYSYSAVVHVHYADKGAITIFPNPAGSTLIVQGLDAAETNTISLYDVQGKLLRKVSVRTASHHLSLHGLVPGTYMLRVQNTKGASSHRFVKQ